MPKKPNNLSPDFQSKQRESMVRRHRVVVYMNDLELDALDRYRAILKDKPRAPLCREAIMKQVFEGLEENQPTLF